MIEIYTKNSCHYCVLAKKLLESKNIKYKEHILEIHILRERFIELFPEQRTLPLIIDNGAKIGGYQELVKYLKEGYQSEQEVLLG